MLEEINKTVVALVQGKTILYPTDTIWGLGCDPQNDQAIAELYNIKQRDDRKAMIVLIAEMAS